MIHSLVVDDDPALRESLRIYLERDGYSVRTAADGLEGFALFQELKPQFVLLDLQLPKMDGFEVLRKIKKSSIRTQVIIITAHDGIDTTIRVIKDGA